MGSLIKEKKDLKKRKSVPTLWHGALLLIFFTLLSQVFSVSYAFSEERLAVFIVMDASGSLKQTDPRGARKIAAEIFLSLLEPNDMISIIEFEKDAKVLLPLIQASERKKATEIIEKIGQTGEFTDYRKALDITSKELEKIKDPNLSKMIIFFTDGILEPDLTDSIYAPYHQEYLREMKYSKQASERESIRKKYNELVIPKTERIIYEEILPEIVEKAGEIYSIGLTESANTGLLKDLSTKTTKHEEETHFFLANSFTDLTKEFIKVLGCRRPIFIAHQKNGIAEGKLEEGIFLDPYIQKTNFNLVFDKPGVKSTLFSPSGKEISSTMGIGGVFYNYADFPHESGKWRVQLEGMGPFLLLALAKSNIEIDLKGLRKNYKCKEPVEFSIRLISEGKLLNEQSLGTLNFLIHISNPLGQKMEFVPQKQGNEFRSLYLPNLQGTYYCFVELKARDKQNGDILPRPGKEMNFYVDKDITISRREIFFGNYWRGGKEKIETVDIESCIDSEIVIQGETKNIICTNRNFDRNKNDRIPQINVQKITLNPGIKRKINIRLSLPKKVYRGDYKGEIRFFSGQLEPQTVIFRVHIYTFWEILKRVIPFLIAFFSGIVCYFIYIFGFLPSPRGFLIVKSKPQSSRLRNEINLRKLKKGLFTFLIGWKRNELLIANNPNANLKLDEIDKSFMVVMAFRWGWRRIRVRLINESKNREIPLERINLRPRKLKNLESGESFSLDGFTFVYEDKERIKIAQ